MNLVSSAGETNLRIRRITFLLAVKINFQMVDREKQLYYHP